MPIFGCALLAEFVTGALVIRFVVPCCPMPGQPLRGQLVLCAHDRTWLRRRYCWMRVSRRAFCRRAGRIQDELDRILAGRR